MANGLLTISPAQASTHSQLKKRGFFPTILLGSFLLLLAFFFMTNRLWFVRGPGHTPDCRNATKIFTVAEAIQAPEHVCLLLIASDAEFGQFPKLIPKLSHLTMLTIKHVTFTHIPPEIAQLEQLRDLRIFNTEETFLPAEIGQLPLESLSINHTDLFYLPAEIGQLKKLKHLSISASPELLTLPATLKDLSALEGLTIRALPYLTFPQGFRLPPRLTALELSANNLTEIPEFVYGLPNLTSLVLTDNAISEISPRLFQLSKLKTLRISDNRLSSLPSLQAFTELSTLDISHNRLQTLPKELRAMDQLRYLGIAGNMIKESEVALLRKAHPTLIINQ